MYGADALDFLEYNYKKAAWIKLCLTPFPPGVTSDVTSDFTSSPLDNPSDNTRFFCTYHLAG
jgi:hypothetical protein